jgi:class 3 adenylate cyclase
MAIKEALTEEVEKILSTKWDVRDGTVIPTSDSVGLGSGAVKIKATFLYADLAGSSNLAANCPWETTAKIIRAYLNICTRLIKAHGGEIRSFDGDRVMGIFIGDAPNTNAIKCARKIDWVVHNVLNEKAKRFASIKNNSIMITHCVGIDTSDAVAVRAGIRNNNDLIWIGRAPSFAAKLSDIRNYPYTVFVSSDSFKIASNQDTTMWKTADFTYADNNYTVYKTLTPLQP